MKCLLVVILLVGSLMTNNALAASLAYYSPLPSLVYPAAHVYSAHSSALVTPSQHQYHTQDEFGQYSYGYNEPLSAKQEVRSLDGTTRGSYHYLDAEGKLQTVAYTADNNGFHVAATNLPRAVVAPAAQAPTPITDTVEVAMAREAHLANYQAARLRLAASESTNASDRSESISTPADSGRSVELPKPVEDTPAVAFAKAQHLKRFEQEKLRNELIGNSLAEPATTLVHPAAVAPTVYSFPLGYPLTARLIATGYRY